MTESERPPEEEAPEGAQPAGGVEPAGPPMAPPAGAATEAAPSAEAKAAGRRWQPAGGAPSRTVAQQRAEELKALQPYIEAQLRRRAMSRRMFLRLGFWGTTAMASVAALWTVGGDLIGTPGRYNPGTQKRSFLWPPEVRGFGGPVSVPKDLVPKPGDDPAHFLEGKFWLVNLEPGQGAFGGFGEPSAQGGLLALYQKCPHLGCTVPWRPDFRFDGVPKWFRCPCHGSTYTRGGIRVFGPAPRPMDTMALEVTESGDLVVNTGDITLGAVDNPNRAVPYTF